MQYFKKYFLVCFMLFCLGLTGFLSGSNIAKTEVKAEVETAKPQNLIEENAKLKGKFSQFEDMLSDKFVGKLAIVEKYGGFQRFLNKTMVDDPVTYRRVFKGDGGMLYYIIPEKDVNDEAVLAMKKLKEDIAVPIFCILPPNKNTKEKANLPNGVLDYSVLNENELYDRLSNIGIKTLSLSREYIKEKKSEKETFYMTDTHWRNETAFWAYQRSLKFLEKEMFVKFHNADKSNSLKNYKLEKFKGIYIGSMGKRVGKEYIEQKDDYTLIIPKFDTKYTYIKYDENYKVKSEKKGSFEEVFVNRWVISDKNEYTDKYITMMDYGAPYEVIVNDKIDAGVSLVIIRDSFAMPFSAYLASNVKHIYMFDTRYENIRRTLRKKIEEVSPDAVLLLCNSSSAYYFDDMFEF
ncbi:MAG: hypothetical protein HXK71_00735 [Clostridiales bacterium]|nr:hypothetical protein [Clostridiales bacterium]